MQVKFLFYASCSLFLLSGCQSRYSSQFEAERACLNWVKEKPGEFQALDSYFKMTETQYDLFYQREEKTIRNKNIYKSGGYFPIRDCIKEENTSQILGLTYEGVKDKDAFFDDLPTNPDYLKGWRHRKGNPPPVKIRNFKY